MARSKPPTVPADGDFIVKAFRVAEGEPVTVRLINPAPHVATIRPGEPFATQGDTITIPGPTAGGKPVTFDFEVRLNPTGERAPATPVTPIRVEVASGRTRYRETIMPAVRGQRLRYHLYYGEAATGHVLCPTHGPVHVDHRGWCPGPPPHQVDAPC